MWINRNIVLIHVYCFNLFQGGQHNTVNDPDPEKIKTQIAVYYNYFTKYNDVVFTVPYNDSGGFGKKKIAVVSFAAIRIFVSKCKIGDVDELS